MGAAGGKRHDRALAEAEGESAIYRDLRMKLFIDPADMKAKYESSAVRPRFELLI